MSTGTIQHRGLARKKPLPAWLPISQLGRPTDGGLCARGEVIQIFANTTSCQTGSHLAMT